MLRSGFDFEGRDNIYISLLFNKYHFSRFHCLICMSLFPLCLSRHNCQYTDFTRCNQTNDKYFNLYKKKKLSQQPAADYVDFFSLYKCTYMNLTSTTSNKFHQNSIGQCFLKYRNT